jgi:ATPase subunit of ABC transporter with duplicated ATPase domains
MPSIRLRGVSFAFSEAAPLLSDVTLELSGGFVGLVGENGVGKTTLLNLLAGRLRPDEGSVRFEPEGALVSLCPQQVDSPTVDIFSFAERQDGEARKLRDALRTVPSALERWPTLSPGERKRWQVGAALAAEPDILLLDEPTNHADAELRSRLLSALRRFKGLGIVVSHDRALLESLTSRTLRLRTSKEASLYPGPYGAARKLWEEEEAALWERRKGAQAAARDAHRKLDQARRNRQAAEASLSGKHLDRKDHDARTLGAKTVRAWAENRLGRQVNRRRAAAERAEASIPDVPVEPELGRSVFLHYQQPPRPMLLSLNADALRVADKVLLRDVYVQLGRGERVRLEGPNGSGKTTLLRELLANATLPSERILFLPQEILPEDEGALRGQVKALPPDERGRVLSLVAALGANPSRLLASQSLSPGEARKLSLALGMGRHAWLLVLDEPTNHLDLPSVERLEEALAAFPGALLLVTHDDSFAARCTQRSWKLQAGRVL